jgi:hypothetical protein
VLIRRAWHWLERRHEPLVVGAAVALMGLSYLLPVTAPSEQAATSARANGSQRVASLPPRLSPPLPADDQFFRDRWTHDAKAFYARQAYRQPSDAAAETKNASLARSVADGKFCDAGTAAPVTTVVGYSDDSQTRSPVAHAYQAVPQTDTGSTSQIAVAAADSADRDAAAAMIIPARLKRWRVATCLAAGLLASILFASVWPVASGNAGSAESSIADATSMHTIGLAPAGGDSARGEAIPIRLPAAWVGIRPTMSQMLRRGVLCVSYLIAGLGGWGMLG